MTEPWAFIAHKEGFWAGMASPKMPRKDLEKFLGRFVADGFTITAVPDENEYKEILKSLRPWSHRSPPPILGAVS